MTENRRNKLVPPQQAPASTQILPNVVQQVAPQLQTNSAPKIPTGNMNPVYNPADDKSAFERPSNDDILLSEDEHYLFKESVVSPLKLQQIASDQQQQVQAQFPEDTTHSNKRSAKKEELSESAQNLKLMKDNLAELQKAEKQRKRDEKLAEKQN